MIEFPIELLGDWNNRKEIDKLTFDKDFKFMNRSDLLKRSWRNLVNTIPTHLDKISKGSKSLLDMSAGNGAVCELMRHLGYDIMACDWYNDRPYYSTYKPFLESQDIPYVVHDCRILPYPFEDKSYDVLTCVGAIGCYVGDVSKFPLVLDEFARITKEVIGISVNKGWKLNEGREYIRNWKHPDFKLTHCKDHVFTWEKK